MVSMQCWEGAWHVVTALLMLPVIIFIYSSTHSLIRTLDRHLLSAFSMPSIALGTANAETYPHMLPGLKKHML